MSDPLCDKCNKPVKDGDARYTALEPEVHRHASCHDWRSSKEKIEEIGRGIEDFRRRLSGFRVRPSI